MFVCLCPLWVRLRKTKMKATLFRGPRCFLLGHYPVWGYPFLAWLKGKPKDGQHFFGPPILIHTHVWRFGQLLALSRPVALVSLFGRATKSGQFQHGVPCFNQALELCTLLYCRLTWTPPTQKNKRQRVRKRRRGRTTVHVYGHLFEGTPKLGLHQ